MKLRRRHRGHKPGQEVVGVKDDGARAVSPDLFERELEAAVGAPLEPVGKRGTGDVTYPIRESPSFAPSR
jgi:hypothetical protein